MNEAKWDELVDLTGAHQKDPWNEDAHVDFLKFIVDHTTNDLPDWAKPGPEEEVCIDDLGADEYPISELEDVIGNTYLNFPEGKRPELSFFITGTTRNKLNMFTVTKSIYVPPQKKDQLDRWLHRNNFTFNLAAYNVDTDEMGILFWATPRDHDIRVAETAFLALDREFTIPADMYFVDYLTKEARGSLELLPDERPDNDKLKRLFQESIGKYRTEELLKASKEPGNNNGAKKFMTFQTIDSTNMCSQEVVALNGYESNDHTDTLIAKTKQRSSVDLGTVGTKLSYHPTNESTYRILNNERHVFQGSSFQEDINHLEGHLHKLFPRYEYDATPEETRKRLLDMGVTDEENINSEILRVEHYKNVIERMKKIYGLDFRLEQYATLDDMSFTMYNPDFMKSLGVKSVNSGILIFIIDEGDAIDRRFSR